MSVCGDQVSFLCVGYIGSELLVQVVKVDCKVSGPGRGNVPFGVDSNARMVTLVGVEQSQACCSIQGQYCYRQTPPMVVVQTSCSAGNCSRLRDTVPESG